MQYINNNLCISSRELGEFFPTRTIRSWGLEIIKPGKGADNYTFYNYLSIPESKRTVIEQKIGKPEIKAQANTFAEKVQPDAKAREFFSTYVLADGRYLPENVIEEYCANASVLNAMQLVIKDAFESRAKVSGKKPSRIFERLSEAVNSLRVERRVEHSLPEAFIPLKRVYLAYVGKKEKANGTTGYTSLISGKYCNENSRKIDLASDKDVLLKLIAHHNQFDNVFIAQKYNEEWAKPHDKKLITAATVLNYRNEYQMEVMGLRDGFKKAFGKMVPIIRRSAPTAPLLFVGSDDVHIDWYFKAKGIEGRQNDNFFRPKMILVVDAHHRYPLGWAVGENITVDLIKAAYLNALHHIKELTGGFYSFHQLQYDKFGTKKLTEIYNAISRFDINGKAGDPTKKHPRNRFIEGFFNKETHRILKQNPHGYSGHNWDAKSKINSEFLQMDMKNYPELMELPLYMHWLVNEMRNAKAPGTELTKKEAWLQSWNEMPEDKRIPMSDVSRLSHFGIKQIDKRTGSVETYTLRNDVIACTIGGKKREFMWVDQQAYIDNYGVKFQLNYDLYDLSTVLAVSECGTRKMLLKESERVPMALADHNEGTRSLLNFRLAQQKGIVKHLSDSQRQIQEAPLDLDGLLKMNVEKGLKLAAESMFLMQSTRLVEDASNPIETERSDLLFNGASADFGFEDETL